MAGYYKHSFSFMAASLSKNNRNEMMDLITEGFSTKKMDHMISKSNIVSSPIL